jgi:hypothetical protein
LMVLLPIVNMAILLEVLGSTLWTHVCHDHSSPLASLHLVGVCGQPYHGIVSKALPV